MAHYSSVDQLQPGQHNNSPYGSGNAFYAQSTGYISPAEPPKKRTSGWIKIGLPVLILVIAGAVVGGILGTRHSKNASASGSGSSGGSGDPGSPAAASSAVSVKAAIGIYATATNSKYEIPIYPATTNTAAFTTPTFLNTNNAALAWPADSFQPPNPAPTSVRPDRPRIIAPKYKWDALPNLIKSDPYMKKWNDQIMSNATDYYNKPVVVYYMDGGSGILDNCREVKQRVKAFAYAHRMSGDSKWGDRIMKELQNTVSDQWPSASPNDPDDKWNSNHFLDVAEMTAAFAIAYDWLYDTWQQDEKDWIRSTMMKHGLSYGNKAYNDKSVYFGWWRNTGTYGNWNCVCNGGLTLGSLAILGDDDTGLAAGLLPQLIANANTNCVYGPTSDGTWTETADYWYFGTTGHAEMTSALLTAAGSDFGLATTNPNFVKTGQYHMYAFGATSLFQWGDHGPNKYSATANSMFLYSNVFKEKHPEYALFQREQFDAQSDPWSMFWYDPSVSGAFWNGLALDHFFTNETDQWASMRGSWTDINSIYVAMKGGKNVDHQTHNDLDVGDFVFDALGHRFIGEFGSANYLGDQYFSNDTQNSERWLYYRKRTEGQNTIVVNKANQNVNAAPTILGSGTSNTTQGSSTVMEVPSDSTAFFTIDMTSAYDDTSSAQRGIRLINGRKQMLLQDDITSAQEITWMAHTNATVSVDDSGTSMTLTIDDKVVKVELLNPPQGAKFTTELPAVRFSSDPSVPSSNDPQQQAWNEDQPNPGVTEISLDLPAGTYSLQVLFSPQWDGMSASDFKTPSQVAVKDWNLRSHD